MNTVLQCYATVHANVAFLTTSKNSMGFSMYYTVLADNNAHSSDELLKLKNFEWKTIIILCTSVCLSKHFVDGVLHNYALKYSVYFSQAYQEVCTME